VESRLNQVKSLIDRFIVEVGKRAYKDSNSGKDTELEDLAQNKFKEALEFNPNNTEAIYYLGLVEVTKHNPQAALGYFRQVLEKEPGKDLRYRAYIQIGRIYYQEQSLVLAEDAIDKALNLLPNKSTAHYYKAMILAKSGDRTAAMPFAQKAVELKHPKAQKLVEKLAPRRR
jgi:tetratricopeptide (TPR) repeat protein